MQPLVLWDKSLHLADGKDGNPMGVVRRGGARIACSVKRNGSKLHIVYLAYPTNQYPPPSLFLPFMVFARPVFTCLSSALTRLSIFGVRLSSIRPPVFDVNPPVFGVSGVCPPVSGICPSISGLAWWHGVTLGLSRNQSAARIKGNQATFDNSQRNNLRSCVWVRW